MVMLGTVALTGYLYVVIPKGSFPQQDTGLIIGQSEASQDISFSAMAQRQRGLIDARLCVIRPSPPWGRQSAPAAASTRLMTDVCISSSSLQTNAIRSTRSSRG